MSGKRDLFDVVLSLCRDGRLALLAHAGFHVVVAATLLPATSCSALGANLLWDSDAAV